MFYWIFLKDLLLLLPVFMVFLDQRMIGSNAQRLCDCQETENPYSNLIHIANISESLTPGSVIQKLNITGEDNEIDLWATYPARINISFDNTTREFKVKQRFNVTGSSILLLNNIILTCRVKTTNQQLLYNVVIDVYDENDNAPIFLNLPYVFNVSEITPIGSVVTSEIVAIDADPSDAGKLTYSIRSSDEQLGYFEFAVPSSGKLVLQKQLDREKIKKFSLIADVKDNSYNTTILGKYQPQHITSTAVIVNVISILEEIPDILKPSYNININYSASKGSRFPIDQALENRDSLQFSLVEDPQNDDWKSFSFTNSTGQLEVVKNLTKDLYFILFKVSKEMKSLFATSLLVINRIKSVSFIAKFLKLVLVDSIPVGTVITRMETTNTGNSQLRFQLPTETPKTKYFEINATSGILKTNKSLDDMEESPFNVSVVVIDISTGDKDTSVLQITVCRAGGSPRFSERIYKFKYKDSGIIGQVQANKSSLPLSYKLIDEYGSFSIDDDGVISCNNCSSINDQLIPLVVVAETKATFNRSTSALVLITRIQAVNSFTDEPNYYVAFIISIVLACIFLIILIACLITAFCHISKSKKKNRNCNMQSPTESRDSSSSSTYNDESDSTIKQIQRAFSSTGISKIGKKKSQFSEVKTISSEVVSGETSDIRMLVNKDAVSSNTSLERLDLRVMNVSSFNKKSLDWTSSQETINASNMTLTRPAVGTNGITVYY